MNNRIQVLDIARGAAILGTLGTNIWIFSALGTYDFLFDELENFALSWETTIEFIFTFFTNGKFLGLLTILFGVGLEIKRQSYMKSEQRNWWPWIYIWGMALLFLDGFLHYLFVFEFDVLMSYAVTGIIVAFLLKCSTKVIKRVTIFLFVVHLLIVALLTLSFEFLFRTDELRTEFLAEMQAISAIYLSGTYFEQVMYRWTDFLALRMEAIFIIPMNILLFLLGVYLVRSGLFAQTEESKKRRKKYLLWGLGLGIPLNAIVFLPLYSMSLLVRYLFAPLMAVGYLMLFHYLLDKRGSGFFFNRLSEVGRTALSCYILQNVVASLIFYGFGLGLGGELGSVQVIGIWACICILMMGFAHVWLKFYSSGPIELVWRWLTNLPVKLNARKRAA